MSRERNLLYTAYAVSASSQLAFGMVIPQLPRYLEAGGMVTAAGLGAVLGVRVVSQRVGGLLGGGLADRFGFRGTTLAAVVVRSAGLLVLAYAGDLTMLVVGLSLVGLGGALFGPGLNVVFGSARNGHARRESAYRWGATWDTIGSALGPLIGAVLLGVGFAWLCLGSAAVYLGIGAVFLWGLRGLAPEQPPAPAGVLARAGEPWRDAALWSACLALLPYFLLSQQNYVVISLDLIGFGADGVIPYLFAANALVTFGMSQLLEGRFATRRIVATGRAVLAGYLALGCGAVLVLLAHDTATVVAASVLLSAASVLIEPAFRARVYGSAPSGLHGTYFGASGLIMGGCAFAGSWLGGLLTGYADQHGAWALTWLAFLACAAAGVLLARLPAPRGYVLPKEA
ncbi:MFS transporter [Catellatospora bangladeshensis]|uniref:Putative ABC transport system membrane protein n=1 Tax=Catellatospora bangladeshensis TaxID=310355 RepID=A0A8J3JVA1_9ACTN|nr:MFS transporter [Catellatospora bangladeshensis]GIF84364.1 putative ABC transport system membrane protein [Catellatospora bangladeshensis]